MDVGTIYHAADHQFYHKWAILTDGCSAAIKGYLKLDVSVIAKGDFLRSIKVRVRNQSLFSTISLS